MKSLKTPISVLTSNHAPSDRTLSLTIVGGFVIFLAAAILPRIGLIMAGASEADDWSASYTGHLISYRPVAALELWAMQSLLGSDYLTFKLPKVLSAIWYALSLTVLLRLALQFGVPMVLFILIGVAALLHPAFNELILWGVLSTLAFLVFLSVSGVAIIYLSKSPKLRFAGVILLALGAAGSQILSTLGAGVVFVELLRRGMRAVISDGRKEVLWRVAVVFVPPLVSIGVLLLMRYGMGYEDYASRSIGFSSPTALGWLKDKVHVYSDAYANLYQAPIGVVFGSSIALKAFKAALVLPIIFLYFLFVSSGLTKARALMYALGPLAAFCVALAPLLGATALPFGYRIVGEPFVLYIFCLSTVLIPIWHAKTMSWIVGVLAVVSAISIWASSTDLSVREVALKRDYAWLADTRIRMKETGATEVRLCSQPFVKPTMFNTKAERGILVSYSPMSVDAHSVWYNHFLSGFLKVNGVKSSVVESHQRSAQCVQSCQVVGRSTVGNFLTHVDEALSSLFMCTK